MTSSLKKIIEEFIGSINTEYKEELNELVNYGYKKVCPYYLFIVILEIIIILLLSISIGMIRNK